MKAAKEEREPIFGADQELISFVQRAVGYTLTGDTREHALFLLREAGRMAVREQLRVQHHGFGRHVSEERIDEIVATQAEGEAVAAATMLPARTCAPLVEAGIDRKRAIELVMSVGTAVIEAVAFLEVVTIVELDDAARGAA
ncbi:MAG: hypothetical protein ACRETH_13000 [Steroidobacteraceae bacterium]